MLKAVMFHRPMCLRQPSNVKMQVLLEEEKVVGELREGLMNKVAQSMSYERFSDIPYAKLDEYAEKLIEHYGPLKAFRMAHIQTIFRKHIKNGAKGVVSELAVLSVVM